LIITLLTVIFHALRAAVANPVKALRTEWGQPIGPIAGYCPLGVIPYYGGAGQWACNGLVKYLCFNVQVWRFSEGEKSLKTRWSCIVIKGQPSQASQGHGMRMENECGMDRRLGSGNKKAARGALLWFYNGLNFCKTKIIRF
jgi:hypothetical protein